jgi:MoaA/NifB/PqqE/SkfB family radical SAM enzyme
MALDNKNKAQRLELHISYACENNCIFCSEKDQLDIFRGKFLRLSDAVTILTKYRKAGFSHVTLTGGEPSLHPDYLRLVEFAKSSGYSVYTGTSGGQFVDKDFADKASVFLSEISFSLHGPNATIHDGLTGRPGSFDNLMAVMLDFSARRLPRRFANIVACADNSFFLQEIVDLARLSGAEQILVSNLAPEGAGLHKYAEQSLRLDFFRQILPKIIQKSSGQPMRFFGLPLCVFGNEYAEYSNDLWWSSRETVELWKTEKSVNLKRTVSPLPSRKRIKPESRCSACARFADCGGVFEEYFKLYGSSELKPFVNE